jgi:hypothetical protein
VPIRRGCFHGLTAAWSMSSCRANVNALICSSSAATAFSI